MSLVGSLTGRLTGRLVGGLSGGGGGSPDIDPVADESGNFTLVDSRFVALQVEIASGTTESIDAVLTGDVVDTESFSTSESYLENMDGADYGNSHKYSAELGPGTYNLVGSGTFISERVAIGTNNSGKVPQILGNGGSADPRALVYDGDRIESHVILNSKEIYVSVNKIPIGEIFGDIASGDIDAPDTYHRSCCFAKTANGLLAVTSSHNKPLFYRYVAWDTDLATTAAALCAASSVEHTATTADSFTYNYLATSTDGDTVYCMTRATDGGNQIFTILHITGFDTTISITEDYVGGDRWYPRSIIIEQDDDGNDALLAMGTIRESTKWSHTVAGVYEPDTNQWYNCNGQTIGGTSNGTLASLRWAGVNFDNDDYTNGGPTILADNGSANRYVPSISGRLHGWANSGGREAEFISVFIDSATVTDGYDSDGADYRICVVRGNEQSITSSKSGNSPAIFDDLNTATTFRLDSKCYYVGDVAHWLTILGSSSGIDATNDYYNWGAAGNASDEAYIEHFSVNLNGDVPTDLDTRVVNQGRITVACPENERMIMLGSIANSSDVIAHVGVGHVADSDRQGESVVTSISNISVPSLVSATVAADGLTWTLVFDEAVSQGSGFDVTDFTYTDGGVFDSIDSGDGTATWTATGDTEIVELATVALGYAGTANGIENSGGVDLQSISGAVVVNDSEVTPVYLFVEDFEGVGTPTSFVENSSGDDFDYTPTPTSPNGGEVLQATGNTTPASYRTVDSGTRVVYFQFYIETLSGWSAPGTRTLLSLRTSSDSFICGFGIDNSGNVYSGAAGSYGSAAANQVSGGQWYHGKLTYVPSGTCSAEFSTDGTFANSGGNYTTKTGSTATVARLQFRNLDLNCDAWFDRVIGHDTDIGDNP